MRKRDDLKNNLKGTVLETIWGISLAIPKAHPAEIVELSKEMRAWYLLLNSNRVTLSDFSTRQLVEELEKREGVESLFIEPCESKDIHVDGFATVLIVID